MDEDVILVGQNEISCCFIKEVQRYSWQRDFTLLHINYRYNKKKLALALKVQVILNRLWERARQDMIKS